MKVFQKTRAGMAVLATFGLVVSAPAQTGLPREHANLRGPDYYH